MCHRPHRYRQNSALYIFLPPKDPNHVHILPFELQSCFFVCFVFFRHLMGQIPRIYTPRVALIIVHRLSALGAFWGSRLGTKRFPQSCFEHNKTLVVNVCVPKQIMCQEHRFWTPRGALITMHRLSDLAAFLSLILGTQHFAPSLFKQITYIL